MEGIEQEVLDELAAKAIEREVPTIESQVEEIKTAPPSPIKKTKKQRSEKQIAAFEKARVKRAENLKLKREQQAAEKELKKTKIKEIKETPQLTTQTTRTETPNPIHRDTPTRRGGETVVQNHYYYYGQGPPPDTSRATKKKSRKKVKRPPTPSSSSEETSSSEEDSSSSEDDTPDSPVAMPDSYKELQEYEEDLRPEPQQRTKPKLKFGFA